MDKEMISEVVQVTEILCVLPRFSFNYGLHKNAVMLQSFYSITDEGHHRVPSEE